VRRRARDQEAAAMNDLLTTEPGAAWEEIAPHLDGALGELSEPDRDALLLRCLTHFQVEPGKFGFNFNF
jgi:DNA-directed RNA polymerase specialized sigma24 family protein